MKRPCECGCSFNDHAKVEIDDPRTTMKVFMYCRECAKTDGIQWCYAYRPCKNLEYLEWLSK
jgi:hypothetical protein